MLIPLDDPDALDAAEAALRAGDAIVLPTDTVYGLAALPDYIDRLYVLKGRPDSVPIAVLVESVDQARTLVRMPVTAERVADVGELAAPVRESGCSRDEESANGPLNTPGRATSKAPDPPTLPARRFSAPVTQRGRNLRSCR